MKYNKLGILFRHSINRGKMSTLLVWQDINNQTKRVIWHPMNFHLWPRPKRTKGQTVCHGPYVIPDPSSNDSFVYLFIWSTDFGESFSTTILSVGLETEILTDLPFGSLSSRPKVRPKPLPKTLRQDTIRKPSPCPCEYEDPRESIGECRL